MASKSKVIPFRGKKPEDINFKVFAQLVAAGELPKASTCLRDIFGFDLTTAEKACLHFSKRYVEDENVIFQTMEIRSRLMEGKQNEALLLIQKIFGISGLDSIKALEAAKKLG